MARLLIISCFLIFVAKHIMFAENCC